MWHGAAGGEVCTAPPRAAGRNRDGVLGTAHASGVAIADLLRNFSRNQYTHPTAPHDTTRHRTTYDLDR